MRFTALVGWILFAGLACGPIVRAAPSPARIEKVIDGDTLKLADETEPNGKISKGPAFGIRGIAAPAPDQPFGKEAHDRLKEIIEGKGVVINGPTPRAHKEGNAIFFRTEKGESLAKVMVSEGLAWVLEAELEDKHRKPTDAMKPNPQTEEWKQAEREAREAKRGLWADKDPVPPWEWKNRTK